MLLESKRKNSILLNTYELKCPSSSNLPPLDSSYHSYIMLVKISHEKDTQNHQLLLQIPVKFKIVRQ